MSEVRQGVIPQTLWSWKEVGSTRNAKQALSKLLEAKSGDDLFLTPKPVELIKRMLQISSSGENDIVLDFFAGSGSIFEAVFELSKEDEIKRNCICVQLPEIASDSSTISDMAKERIRLAGNKIRNESDGQFNFGSNQQLDLGFKVLKLNQSNFKQWQAPAKDISDEELVKQFELNVDHVDPNAPKEYLLYELLIKAGVKPTVKIETIELASHSLYSVDEGILLIFLENEIQPLLIDAIVEQAPQQFICLDSAFHGNDQLKTNAAKTFEAYNQGKESIDRIEFLTV